MPPKLNPDLLRDFAGRTCELCMSSTRTHAHHLWGKGMGGGGQLDVPINLVPLCDNCHRLVHMGHVKRALLLKLVGWRENTTPERIEAEIHKLRRGRP